MSEQGYIGIPCPFCGGRSSEVLDSRSTKAGFIRRRRDCLECRRRFTTRETVELIAPEEAMRQVGTVLEDAKQKIRDLLQRAGDL